MRVSAAFPAEKKTCAHRSTDPSRVSVSVPRWLVAPLLAACGGTDPEPSAALVGSGATRRRATRRRRRRLAVVQPHARGRPVLAARRDRPRQRRAACASRAPTRCPRWSRCKPARSSSTARCTSRRNGARTRSMRPRARRSGTSSGRARARRRSACIAASRISTGRLFRGTSDAHVLALDATDGHTLWDVTMDVAETPGVSMPMAPIAANGLVFIGNAGGDQTGVTGHVYALDAQDGHRRLALRRRARRAGRARDVAERGPLPDHGRRVLDVVRARHRARRALRAGGQPGARLRRRSARRRQPVHELADRARRGDRPDARLQPARQARRRTTGT